MSTVEIEPRVARFWSRKSLAETCGVTVQTIGNWQKAGLLPPAVRLGHKWMWRSEDVAAFLSAKASGGAA